MKLTNFTDIPTDKVRELIRFACPPGVTRASIHLKNHPTRVHAAGVTTPLSRSVSIKLPKAARQPPIPGGRGYLPFPSMTRDETLLVYLAHELRHVWQFLHPSCNRVWGARGQYSERDADAYALRVLRRWRREAPTSEAVVLHRRLP